MSQMWQPRFDVREAYSFPRGPTDGLQCSATSGAQPAIGPVGTYNVTPTATIAAPSRRKSDDGSSQAWSEMLVMPKDEFMKVAARAGANYSAATLDTYALARVLNEMGLKGRATIKSIKGKDYVILSGHAGLRKTLTGTKYGIRNAKVVQMGIGPVGAAKSALKGGGITIVLTVGANILEAVLNDEDLLTEKLGLTIATDVGKAGLAAAAGYVAGIVVGGVVGVAAAPLAAGIVVGVGFSLLIDQVYPTDQIVSKMRSSIAEAGRKKDEALRTFYWVNTTAAGAIWFMQGFSGGRTR